jgi:hypothetical protein
MTDSLSASPSWCQAPSRAQQQIFVTLRSGIDCSRLPRQAMFVVLPRKVDTIYTRAAERTLQRPNLARVEPNRSGSLSRGKGISVCYALSVERVLWCSGISFEAKWRMKNV